MTATATPIKGSKGGSSSPRTPTEAPDDLQSVAKAKVLLALGEGEWAGNLDGTRIFLDGTPLIGPDGSSNFSGVTWEFRPGTQHQAYIQGMPGTENEISTGTPLTKDKPWIHSFNNSQLSAARLRFKWPQLLQQSDNGDVNGYSINYAVDLQTNGGAWKEVINESVSGKTTTGYERTRRIDLPQDGTNWAIRARRITADSTSSMIADKMTIESYTEVIDAKLRYPNTALLYIEFDSSQFNGSIPQISCEPDMRIVRVPTNYDPINRTYSGTWDGSFKWAWTNNPAWVLYDIIISDRFGLGQRLNANNVDKWELYRVAQYCDQQVPDGRGGSGTEPRYICNVYVQDRNDAYTVIRDFSAIFRGMTYWGNNQLVALADMPRDIDYNYTRANVVDGLFTYSSSTTKARYTTALVSWSDPDNAYNDAMEPVFEQELVMRYGTNQLELTAIGCTRQSEANRKGRWGILTNNKDRVVTFSVGLDGMIPLPGYIISVSDELLSGKVVGGRISSVNGRAITLDRKPDAELGDRIIVNLPSGASQSRTIQSISDKVVTVTAPFSMTPEAESVWVIESDKLFAQQYRVVGITDNGDNTFTITGAYHDPDKYARIDTGAVIDERPISVIPSSTQIAPDNVKIDSYSMISQGLSVETLRSTWNEADGAIAYEAQWRKDSSNWVSVPRSSTTSFEVTGIYAGDYMVRVRAINAAEISSSWSYSTLTKLTGKIGKPPVPVGFKTTPINWGIQLDWGIPEGAEDTRNTEIQYSQSASGDNPLLLTDVPYPQRQYAQLGLKAGQEFWYRARLVDKIGNEGDWTDWIYGQASVDVSDITDAILEQIKDTETFKDLIENAVESSEKLKELADAITDNAYQLADIVGSNKQTADAIISNSLAIADVVVRQTAQNGANSAKYEQLREVIATETNARVTDVIRLEAKTAQNEAGITEVRQAIATETEARASAVTQLTASTQVISSKADAANDKAIAADGKANTANDKADNANRVGQQNTASITELSQVVTTLDSAMSSRLEELSVQAGVTTATVQNNAIAIIDHAVTQVNLRTTLNAQYGDNKASIERIDNVIVSEKEATAQSLQQIRTDVAGNASSITNLSQTVSNYQQTTATQINSLSATVNGHTSAIEVNAKATADINGNLNAMYNIKVGVDSNGRQYAAGMGIGVENTPSGMQSQVIFLADRFAVMSQAGSTVSLPFVIQNDQTFIQDAFIRDGSITNAKIANASINMAKISGALQSDDWDGFNGWYLPKSGGFQIGGSGEQGRTQIDGSGMAIYTPQGNLVIKLGWLKWEQDYL